MLLEGLESGDTGDAVKPLIHADESSWSSQPLPLTLTDALLLCSQAAHCQLGCPGKDFLLGSVSLWEENV